VTIDDLPAGWRVEGVEVSVDGGETTELVRLDGPLGAVLLTAGTGVRAVDGDAARIGGRDVVIERVDGRTTITWTDDGVGVRLDAPGSVEPQEWAAVVAAVETTP
jgi:hypothetical protein